MNKVRLVFGLSAVLGVLGQASSQSEAPLPLPTTETAITGPQIVFESERLSFGKVLDTEPRRVTFKFRNVGSADLRIGEATTAVETVVALPMEKRTFGPGESGELVISVDPSLWRGPITTSVKVPSNSPGQPVRLLIDGFVEKTVNIEPTIARLGWLKPGQAASSRLIVTGRTPDFRVTGVRTMAATGPSWNIQVGEPEEVTINDQTLRRVQVEIASNGPLPEGTIEDTLEISTNDPRRAVMSVLMRGWVGEQPPPKIDAVPVMSSGGKYSTGKPIPLPKRDPNALNEPGIQAPEKPANPPATNDPSKPETP